MMVASGKGQLAPMTNTMGGNLITCPMLQDSSTHKYFTCSGLRHISNNCPYATKVAAGQVVPDHDNNIGDPYEGLRYEEDTAFDDNKDIIKEVTPDEDDPQYNMSEGTPLNNIVIDNPKVHYEPDAKIADGLTHSHIGTIVPPMDQSPTLNQMDITINNNDYKLYDRNNHQYDDSIDAFEPP
jgi:hypothetical protein